MLHRVDATFNTAIINFMFPSLAQNVHSLESRNLYKVYWGIWKVVLEQDYPNFESKTSHMDENMILHV